MKEDFKVFLAAVWEFLGLPEPTPVQNDIADFLQYGPRRKVVMAFRGVGKSWITSAYVLWKLHCDPQTKILVVSASKSRSDDFSTFCLRLLQEMPELQYLYPSEDQRCSRIAFDVAPAKADHAPSVKSAGITGQLAGSRANEIVADDIEIPNNSDTQMMRDKLSEAVKEFDAVLKPGGAITYLGTPQTEMSLYNELPNRGYVVRIWPARYPTSAKMEKYGNKLAPFVIDRLTEGAEAGDSTDPRRFDDDDLRERELSYGRSGFALQFQLDTSLADAERYPLKLSDLVVTDLDPQKGPTDVIWSNAREHIVEVPTVGLEGDRYYRPMVVPQEYSDYTGCVMAIDPSGRGKDETSWAVVAMLLGRMFLLDAGGKRGGYDDNLLKGLLKTASRFNVKRIVVEPNFGDGMFAKLLGSHREGLYNVTIEDAPWSRVQKESRIIETLEPVMNQHRLVVDRKLIERDYQSTTVYNPEEQNRYRLFYQLSRLTHDRGALVNDDRLDALSMAVAYWLENIGQNVDKARKDHRRALLEADLKRHVEFQIGRKITPKSPTIGAIRALSKVR